MERITATYETAGRLQLDIDIPAGDIVVRAHATTATTLSISELRDPDDVSVTFDDLPGGGNKLSIEYRRRTRLRWFDDRRLRVDVGVPEGTDLEVATASADVAGTGRLGSVKVRSASGDTQLGDVTGRVDVNVASGDLTVASVGDGLSYTSASGDLRAGTVAGAVSVRTASGDVAVHSAGGDVRCTTVSGDIDVGSLATGDATFKSVSGDIEVGVAPGTRVLFDLSSTSGSTESELASSPAPGSDEPTLTLHAGSVSGDVRVRRSANRSAIG